MVVWCHLFWGWTDCNESWVLSVAWILNLAERWLLAKLGLLLEMMWVFSMSLLNSISCATYRNSSRSWFSFSYIKVSISSCCNFLPESVGRLDYSATSDKGSVTWLMTFGSSCRGCVLTYPSPLCWLVVESLFWLPKECMTSGKLSCWVRPIGSWIYGVGEG